MRIDRCLMCVGFAVVFMGVAQADEYSGTLIKVVDGKVVFSRGTGKKRQEFALAADAKCRVFTAKINKKLKKIEAGDEVDGGLANPIFRRLEKEAISAWIVTNEKNDTILEMRLYQSTTTKKTK